MALNNTLYNRPNFILSGIVTLLCFVGTYLLFGFYFVEYEGLCTSFFTGKLTPGIAFPSLYYIGSIGLSYIYSFLYQHAPNIEWVSWIYSGYFLASGFIALYLVAALLPVKTPLLVKALVQVSVYLLIFSTHNIHLIYTRIAYMLCGVSLLGLIFVFTKPAIIKQRIGLFMLLNLMFAVGTYTRVEGATACLLLLSVFSFFYLQNIVQCIRLFIIPGILVATLVVGVSLDMKSSTRFYKMVEPDIEAQYIDRQNLMPLSEMKTARDTAIYFAASNMMWSDTQVLNPTYLRTFIISEKPFFTDGRQWQRVFSSIPETALHFPILLVLNLILSALVLFFYPFKSPLWGRVFLLGFEVSFWVLIVIQTYTFKINDRSFAPFLSIYLLCNILLFIKATNHHQFKKWLYPTSALLIVLIAIYIKALYAESNILKADLRKYQSNLHMITSVAKGKYLVLNSSSFDYVFLSNTPYHVFNYSMFKRIYITSGYVIPFIPTYRGYLERECQCDISKYPSFINYLRSKRNDVVIVSAADRMKITVDYLKEVHQYNLPIQELDSITLHKTEKSDIRGHFEDLRVYTLTE